MVFVSVCRRNAAHMQRNWPGAACGGPVVLRPIRATPCWNWRTSEGHRQSRTPYM